MRTVIIAIHLMIVIALVIVVLLQRSEGGALGIGGGGGLMTGRGQSNALTRATAILATLFFITSIVLTLQANMERGSSSLLNGAATAPAQSTPASAPKPAPAAPNGDLLDQLRKMQEQQNAAKGAPSTPAAPAPAIPSKP